MTRTKSKPIAIDELVKAAKSDPSPVVRRAHCSGLATIAGEATCGDLPALASHAEDANDPNLPLDVLVCARAARRVDPTQGHASGGECANSRLLPVHGPADRIDRQPEAIEDTDCRGSTSRAESARSRLAILRGMNEASRAGGGDDAGRWAGYTPSVDT